MNVFPADLHLHTVLSPCADLTMTPLNIVEKAVQEGIKVLAVTDHNSAKNVRVVIEAAKKYELLILPGMEVESREEIHLLCYFRDIQRLLAWQEKVYQALPDLSNDEEFFGYQLITDHENEFLEKEKKLLATATNFRMDQIFSKVKKMGGFVVPAHLDRKNSILSQLGFLPPDLEINLLEISKNSNEVNLIKEQPELSAQKFIINSDSHYLADIKAYSLFKLKRLSIEEVFLALENKKGREINVFN